MENGFGTARSSAASGGSATMMKAGCITIIIGHNFMPTLYLRIILIEIKILPLRPASIMDSPSTGEFIPSGQTRQLTEGIYPERWTRKVVYLSSRQPAHLFFIGLRHFRRSTMEMFLFVSLREIW